MFVVVVVALIYVRWALYLAILIAKRLIKFP